MVVIGIILILVTIAVPVAQEVFGQAERTVCQNNLRQIGQGFAMQLQKAAQRYPHVMPRYPAGGSGRISPGEWPQVHQDLAESIGHTSGSCPLTQCPSAKPDAAHGPGDPRTWATCSYAYVANLATMYECDCAACSLDPDGYKEVWRLYWSGVDYTGDHGSGELGGNLSKFKGLPLADNLAWQAESVDTNEPSTPTIPVHQDTDEFHGDDVAKYLTQRALRAVPAIAEDVVGDQPLAMDILVYRVATLGDLPDHSAAGSEWRATDLNITDENKADVLYANHCHASAGTKKNWGINVCYTSGRVEWKEWEELRFQVMAKGASAGDEHHCYFY